MWHKIQLPIVKLFAAALGQKQDGPQENPAPFTFSADSE